MLPDLGLVLVPLLLGVFAMVSVAGYRLPGWGDTAMCMPRSLDPEVGRSPR